MMIGGAVRRGAATLAVVCGLAGLLPAGPARADGPDGASAPIVVGTTHRLRSAVLGDTRELNVRLPAGYEEGYRAYPVVYLLDGGLEQDFGHIAGLAQLGDLSGTFGPFILVGVQTRTRRAELTPPATDPRYKAAFPDAGGADRFRRFLSEEVFPFVAARYRSEGRRAVMGESLAGLFVVDTLLREPTLFQDYVAVSPSLWWDDCRGLRDPELRLDAAALKGRRLFLAMANEGGTMQSGVDRLRQALERRPAPGFAWWYSDRSATDTHATILHSAAEAAFRAFYAAPPIDYGPTPWFMIEGASPPPAAQSR